MFARPWLQVVFLFVIVCLFACEELLALCWKFVGREGREGERAWVVVESLVCGGGGERCLVNFSILFSCNRFYQRLK